MVSDWTGLRFGVLVGGGVVSNADESIAYAKQFGMTREPVTLPGRARVDRIHVAAAHPGHHGDYCQKHSGTGERHQCSLVAPRGPQLSLNQRGVVIAPRPWPAFCCLPEPKKKDKQINQLEKPKHNKSQ